MPAQTPAYRSNKYVEQFGRYKAPVESLHISHEVPTKFFSIPRLRQYWKKDGTLVRESEERKATWNEIFYDLFYVIAIAHLSHALSHEPTLQAVGKGTLLFYAIWSTWLVTTRYINKFDTHDSLHKFFFFAQLVGVVGMGTYASSAFGSGGAGFVVSYSLTRICLIVMFLIVIKFVKKARDYLAVQICVTIVPTLLWIIGAGFDSHTKIALWTVAVASELLGYLLSGIIGRYVYPKFANGFRLRIPTNTEHFSERFGLFTIIFLGEFNVRILFDQKGTYMWNYLMMMAFFLVIIYAMEWVYFNVEANRQRRHAMHRNSAKQIIWILAHLPLHYSIIVLSAGMANIATEEFHGLTGDDPMTQTFLNKSKWLASMGFAGYMVAVGVIGTVHHSPDDVKIRWEIRVCIRYVLGLFALVLPLFKSALSLLGYTSLLALLTSINLVIEVYGNLPTESQNLQRTRTEELLQRHPKQYWPDRKLHDMEHQELYDLMIKLGRLSERAIMLQPEGLVREILEHMEGTIKSRASRLVLNDIEESQEFNFAENWADTFLEEHQHELEEKLEVIALKGQSAIGAPIPRSKTEVVELPKWQGV